MKGGLMGWTWLGSICVRTSRLGKSGEPAGASTDEGAARGDLHPAQPHMRSAPVRYI